MVKKIYWWKKKNVETVWGPDIPPLDMEDEGSQQHCLHNIFSCYSCVIVWLKLYSCICMSFPVHAAIWFILCTVLNKILMKANHFFALNFCQIAFYFKKRDLTSVGCSFSVHLFVYFFCFMCKSSCISNLDYWSLDPSGSFKKMSKTYSWWRCTLFPYIWEIWSSLSSINYVDCLILRD